MTELDVVCYYHDPVKAPLVRAAVIPGLRAALAARPGVRGHLERHWLHGPHVRVRLRGPDGPVAAAADQLAARLREHLRLHPSTGSPGAPELLSHARKAGLLELVPPPYEPIHADNTVTVGPAETGRVAALLGSAASVRLRADSLEAGLPALEHSLDRLAGTGDSAAGRIELAVTAMAVHAARYPRGQALGYHSFLSHVEDFLFHHDPDGRLRRAFEAGWTRNRTQVLELVGRVADGHPTDQVEAAWQHWTITARLLAEPAFDGGSLAVELSRGYTEQAARLGDPDTARRWNPAERTALSDYHRALRVVDFSRPELARAFAVYRFGTNVLYQLLAVCDVTPVERYLAASMVAAAVQELNGTTWRAQLGETG
ncbi:hypothetical protein ACBI99_01050 [Nonomuraea sp. ATR24]|uniref:hypothetical protein n=1 Tax=unclassified Nonomuraea TaxID=2593643 RepID=UPI0033E557ED